MKLFMIDETGDEGCWCMMVMEGEGGGSEKLEWGSTESCSSSLDKDP